MQKAFSLVELSIVLVILGLLVGGILTGQSLIRAAELRSVTTEFSQYQTAAMTFREKYFSLPGDMTNATDFWGAADNSGTDGECANPDTDAGSGTQTCNGDGDGLLNQNDNEVLRFWQHLANADLIEGSYTGIQADTNTFSHLPGTNNPTGKMSGSGWSAWALDMPAACPRSGHAQYFDGRTLCRNNLWFGGHIDDTYSSNPLLTPEETWNIDKKVDDGKPATGKVTVFNLDGWNNAGGTLERCTLAQSGSDTSAGYALQVDSAECTVVFSNAF